MLLHCVMGRGTAAMERMRTEHYACSEELLVSSENETLPLSIIMYPYGMMCTLQSILVKCGIECMCTILWY